MPIKIATNSALEIVLSLQAKIALRVNIAEWIIACFMILQFNIYCSLLALPTYKTAPGPDTATLATWAYRLVQSVSAQSRMETVTTMKWSYKSKSAQKLQLDLQLIQNLQWAHRSGYQVKWYWWWVGVIPQTQSWQGHLGWVDWPQLQQPCWESCQVMEPCRGLQGGTTRQFHLGWCSFLFGSWGCWSFQCYSCLHEKALSEHPPSICWGSWI